MSVSKKICPICGEPTRVYMGKARKDGLCAKHANDLKNDLLEKCEDCGRWYEVFKGCSCWFCDEDDDDEFFSREVKKVFPRKESSALLQGLGCLLCGEPVSGPYHFCKSCYSKYANKSITVVITNCHEADIVDDYSNKILKSSSGVYVRSQAELTIIEKLFDMGIRCAYESPVPYIKDDGTFGEIHPDFYLPDYDIYIEYWGVINDAGYQKSKEFKKKIYIKENLIVVDIYPDDMKDINGTFKKIFYKYKKKLTG